MVLVEIPDTLVAIIKQMVCIDCCGYQGLEDFVIDAIAQNIGLSLDASGVSDFEVPKICPV